VRAAGAIAVSHFGKVAVERKADLSEVTAADRAVEAFLIEKLRPIEPGARMLGEEGTVSKTEGDGPTWAIDPIDGTGVFVAGLPTWAISVGLIRDGVPELGCVHMPMSNELFLAGRDGPLLWNGAEIRRGDAPPAWNGRFSSRAWFCMSSHHHRHFKLDFPGKLRSFGATAAHFAWTARGVAVATISGGYLWDVAGGLACCRASGLAYSYLSGKPVDLEALTGGGKTPEAIVVAHPDDLEHVRASITRI